MSIILDEHAVISPVPDPDAAVTREELLSLAAPIWQWWRRERPLVRENVQNHITNIRIIETHPTEKFLRMEVWKMSLISDVSLSRSVHQIFVSNIDGSFKSSVIESTDELEILRPGTDKLLRDIALVFLKNNIGWIDSAGSLKVERYPKYKSLVDNIKGRKPTSAHPQASLSLGNSTAPEPEASSEGKGTGLDDISGGGAVAESKSDKREQAQHATSEGNQRSRDENATRVKKRNLLVSATLPDGTLVIPSFKLCQEMDKGVGKSFSFILQIISQWRAQSRNDLKHEYHRKASLVYVFPKASESSFNVEIFRKESNWFDQPMTRYKLYHAPSAEGCLYVDFKPLSGTVLDRRKLGAWKNVLLDNFRFSLRNHVGVVDQAGVLRKSKQPSTNEFVYELQRPTKLYSSAGTETTESSKERYVPPSPTDTRQEGESHERAPKVPMSDQIESVMKLAGDLYEVSTMLNEEISNAPSQPNGSLAVDAVNASWINEPNPVLRTRKHGKINVDAVDRAILQLKAQLRDHRDKFQILAHVCQRWKAELEVEYPLMKRESVSRSGLHNLAIPSYESSSTKSPVTKEKTPAAPQSPAITPRIRFTHSPDRRNDADDDGFSISPF
ncbi:hypothetical protein KCU81_g3250, partial [Aureobasidium melanogenum]